MHEAGRMYGGTNNLKRQKKLSSHKWQTVSFAFFCYVQTLVVIHKP